MAFSLSGIMLMALIDVFIVNVAAPSMARELHATGGELQLVVASYALTYGAFLIVGAGLGDSYGRKRVALLGIGVFAVSSVLCGSASSLVWLTSARLVQGVGAALMVPQVLAMIGTQFEEADRKRAMGLYGATIGLGSILGQVVGGALISADWGHLGWRLVFFVNVPVAVLVLAGIALTVADTRAPRIADGRADMFDFQGAALWSLALCGLCGPVLFGRSAGWSPLLALGVLAGAVAMRLFIGHEQSRKRMHIQSLLLDPAIVAYRALRSSLSVLFLLQASLAAFLFTFALTFQEGLKRSPAAVGYTLVAPGIAFAAVSLLQYRRPGELPRGVAVRGFLIAAAGFVVLGGFGLVGGPRAFGLLMSVPSLLLCGVGIGICFAPSADRAVRSVPEALTGTAAGLVATTLQVANVAGVAVIGELFLALERLAGGSPRHAAVNGFSESLLAVACVLIVWCVVSMSIRSNPATEPARLVAEVD